MLRRAMEPSGLPHWPPLARPPLAATSSPFHRPMGSSLAAPAGRSPAPGIPLRRSPASGRDTAPPICGTARSRRGIGLPPLSLPIAWRGRPEVRHAHGCCLSPTGSGHIATSTGAPWGDTPSSSPAGSAQRASPPASRTDRRRRPLPSPQRPRPCPADGRQHNGVRPPVAAGRPPT